MATQFEPTTTTSSATPAERTDAQSRLLARNWSFVALRGVLALVFGVAAILLPGVTLASLVLLFSAYMFADGVFAIASAVRAARRHERWGWFLLEGVANIAVAIFAALLPGLAVLSFVLLLAAWAIVTGGLMLGAAIRLRTDHGRLWLGIGGVLSIVWGVLLFLQPVVGAYVLTLWLGAYAIAFGIAMVVLALRLRRRATVA